MKVGPVCRTGPFEKTSRKLGHYLKLMCQLQVRLGKADLLALSVLPYSAIIPRSSP